MSSDKSAHFQLISLHWNELTQFNRFVPLLRALQYAHLGFSATVRLCLRVLSEYSSTLISYDFHRMSFACNKQLSRKQINVTTQISLHIVDSWEEKSPLCIRAMHDTHTQKQLYRFAAVNTISKFNGRHHIFTSIFRIQQQRICVLFSFYTHFQPFYVFFYLMHNLWAEKLIWLWIVCRRRWRCALFD